MTTLVLNVPSGCRQGLDSLAAAEGLSRAEVVRRAVALYAFALQQDQQGRRLGFFTGNGDAVRVEQVVSL